MVNFGTLQQVRLSEQELVWRFKCSIIILQETPLWMMFFLQQLVAESLAVSGIFGAISGYIGKDRIRHKGGDVAKATTVYDLAIDGIKNRTRTGDIASQKLISASNKLAKAWVESLSETTVRYTAGAAFSTTGKRWFLKEARY